METKLLTSTSFSVLDSVFLITVNGASQSSTPLYLESLPSFSYCHSPLIEPYKSYSFYFKHNSILLTSCHCTTVSLMRTLSATSCRARHTARCFLPTVLIPKISIHPRSYFFTTFIFCDGDAIKIFLQISHFSS